MPDDPRDWRTAQERDELHDPANPPNPLLKPETRSRALMSYVAPIVILFVVVGVALIYWANRGPVGNAGDRGEENAVGTVGREAPGGGDPVPEFDATGDELRFRGGGPGADAGTGGDRAAGETLMDVAAVASTSAGQRVQLRDIEVDAVDRNTVWIRDNGKRVAVLGPEGLDVNAGDRVDIVGTTEVDTQGAVRIRASEVRER